ncbi:serine hydroxymethyltransferase 1-like protein [Trifolium pratense]|uniref:Serine hydroxymethyltransferase n=1 Tax=Trifolium pratense TaxID=57577 RepID=A0A2K3PDD5_TRIPR|nr:serine hydroxymethyltransferase 1-like protein [Trifolium pratense]
MDLSHHQSNLSLTFSSSHSSPPRRPPIPDDSISLHLESSFRDPSHPVPTVPLQLMEPQTDAESNNNNNNNNNDDDDDREVEEFRILGHSMCLKRRRDCESSTITTTKRAASLEPNLEARKAAVRSWGDQPLQVADPDIYEIIEKEKNRQFKGIELIASENFVCRAVMEALGSHLTNKYSEGMPGARYYGGNQYIDEIEMLCCDRALAAFNLDPKCWGVNVQPYSCTSANFAVYTGLLSPGDRIMGLDTPSGGNTSHGYYTPNGKKISGASIFFESLPYKINPQSGFIDYDKLEERALDFRPKILICGGSSYPREWDYARFRHIADKCGAVLLCDMAQISGIIAAKECVNPFDYCDVVTSTTHKSLRGPRGGGPHNNHIAALAIALKQVATPEYKAYMQQVKKNAQVLASALLRRKCRLVTGGKFYETVCEACHITLNKIAIFGDNGTIIPGGVRIGTPAMTSRGCLETDFETMADFLFRAAQIANMLQREHGKLQKTISKVLESNRDILELRARVEAFATQFALPGFDI